MAAHLACLSSALADACAKRVCFDVDTEVQRLRHRSDALGVSDAASAQVRGRLMPTSAPLTQMP